MKLYEYLIDKYPNPYSLEGLGAKKAANITALIMAIGSREAISQLRGILWELRKGKSKPEVDTSSLDGAIPNDNLFRLVRAIDGLQKSNTFNSAAVRFRRSEFAEEMQKRVLLAANKYETGKY